LFFVVNVKTVGPVNGPATRTVTQGLGHPLLLLCSRFRLNEKSASDERY